MSILGCGMVNQRTTWVLWGGGGQPQHQVTLQRTQQQKVSAGRVSGKGNYDFFLLE